MPATSHSPWASLRRDARIRHPSGDRRERSEVWIQEDRTRVVRVDRDRVNPLVDMKCSRSTPGTLEPAMLRRIAGPWLPSSICRRRHSARVDFDRRLQFVSGANAKRKRTHTTPSASVIRLVTSAEAQNPQTTGSGQDHRYPAGCGHRDELRCGPTVNLSLRSAVSGCCANVRGTIHPQDFSRRRAAVASDRQPGNH